jgi:hypothetical protein
MKRSSKIILLGLGLFLLAAMAGPRPTHSSGSEAVRVVNTPLPVQGTVGVNNFPANQAVSGTIGVNNFPATQAVSGTVNVGNFPSAQQVSFSNTGTTPLYIRDVDNPAHTPFLGTLFCLVPAGSVSCDASFSVPSGSELVIESVSARADLASGERAVVELNVTTNGVTSLFIEIPLTFQITSSGIDTYTANQPVRLYADPGTSPALHAFLSGTSSTGVENFRITVSGYLVSCGSGTGCPLP